MGSRVMRPQKEVRVVIIKTFFENVALRPLDSFLLT